ncbi:MAG TPA: phenylacetate--CoA ligase [Solirubrobacteraceae bacterium]|nr:phenylacetate--CoA ligase [Solirubrobacteraceae bacterium]
MPHGEPSEPLIRDPVETLPREQLRELQLRRLRETVDRVLRGQPAGARRLREAGIGAGQDVRSLTDLGRVAFTTKADLRTAYPFGLLAVPRSDLVRVHASSGTHGKPTLAAYTRTDLETWTELMARGMTMAGVRAGMTIHNANGYGLFTGGLGFHQGGERLGATVVPVSGGFTARQAMLLSDLRAEVLVSTPSYALVIAQALRDGGIDPAGLPLALGLFGGEPWTEPMRAQLQDELGLAAVNFYGLSELCGPGVATECLQARAGLHVQEDHFLVEVVDPDDGRPVAPGTEGELVFTTLSKEAMPLIRYRTRDIGAVDLAPCPCGRTTARLLGLRGRHDDMLIVRGVNLHPSHVEQLLLGVDGASPHYRLILERRGALDELTLEFEPVPGHDHAALGDRVARVLREHTGLRIGVEVVAPGELPRSAGKATRILDRRSVAG